MKKYLRKTAEDNYQLNRTYDILMNNNIFSNEDIYKFTGHTYKSWENANLEGYIEEHYDLFEEWLKDYAVAISQDIIEKAKNENDEFASNYSVLRNSEKEELLDKLNRYILNKHEEIEKAIKNV